MAPQVVLIVDCDLGFAFWLGKNLESPDIIALPARNSLDALELAEKFGFAIDLLILNVDLPDNGRVVETLHQANNQLKVIAFTNHEAEFESVYGVLAFRKPQVGEELSAHEWFVAGPNSCETATIQ